MTHIFPTSIADLLLSIPSSIYPEKLLALPFTILNQLANVYFKADKQQYCRSISGPNEVHYTILRIFGEGNKQFVMEL